MIALEDILASFSIKDQATQNLKKMDRETEKVKKDLSSLESQATKTDKKLSRFGKGFSLAKGGVAKTGETAKSVAAGGAGGFVGALGGLPLGLGAIITAPIIAMRQSVNRFVQGVDLQIQLSRVANDFSQNFSKKLRESLEGVSTFFDTEDIRTAFSSLAGQGIDPKEIEKASRTISDFTKAQGLPSLTAGIQALTTGGIKYGRGLNEAQIRQIQSLGPVLSQGGAAANSAFRAIVSILNQNKEGLQKSAAETEKNLGNIQRASVEITQIQRDLAVDSVRNQDEIEKGLTSLRASTVVEKKINRIVDTVGKGTGTAINKLIGAAGKIGADKNELKKATIIEREKPVNNTLKFLKQYSIAGSKSEGRSGVKKRSAKMETITSIEQPRKRKIDTLPKRAGGGPVLKNQNVITGEHEPEIFTPDTSGRVINQSQINSQIQKEGLKKENPPPVIKIDPPKNAKQNTSAISQIFNNTFNIRIDGKSDNPESIKMAIKNALNELSKTSFRQAAGLPMRG